MNKDPLIRDQITILDDDSSYLSTLSNLEYIAANFKNKNNLIIFEKLLSETNNLDKKIINDLMKTILYNESTTSIDAIKLLVKYGADVNYQDDESSWSPLLTCTIHPINSIETIEFLIESGANVNIKNASQNTALTDIVTASTKINDLEIIKLLIRKGSHVNCKNINGNTSLILSLYSLRNVSIRYDIIKILLDNKADIYIKNEVGENVLDITKRKIGVNSDIYSLIFNYKNIKNDHLCTCDIDFIYNIFIKN